MLPDDRVSKDEGRLTTMKDGICNTFRLGVISIHHSLDIISSRIVDLAIPTEVLLLTKSKKKSIAKTDVF